MPSTSLIPQAHQAPALKSVVPPLGLATLRVLVVEDDPELQWRLARMLTVQGHRVVGTSSGEGALALVGQWTVDIVLLDEHLPGLSGVELLRRLREAHPQLKVALMSRHPGSALQQLHVRAQVDAWIQKPLDRNALQAVLERLAQR
ncbi:MAG: response regulator [Polyangiales bacterium]